jgi:hypothetical protein
VDDERQKIEIARVHRDNFGVYGIENVWRQLDREGIKVGRDNIPGAGRLDHGGRLCHGVPMWSTRFATAVATGAVIVALSSAPVAARTCPSPGTGLAGAANMAAAGEGMAHAMSVDNPNGNAGMSTAVANSAC